MFLDATFGVQCGLLRALGQQLLYATLVLICLFLIGLPTISALAFSWGLNLGLVGMWYGCPGAYLLLNICLLIAILKKDWATYSAEIIEREKQLKLARASLEEQQNLTLN